MDKKALFGDSDGDSSSDDSGDNFRPKPAASNTATAADTTATSKDPKKELLGDSDGDSDDANAPATATGTGSSAPKEEEEEDKVAEETKPTPSPATGAGSSAAKEKEGEKKSASSLASKEPQSLPEFTEKERVAMKLLEQTPPGQLDEVISDLKKLLPSVSDPAIRDACNRYAAKSFEVVPLPADNKHSLLLSEDNCIPQSALSMVYVSSATKKAYSVDAVTKEVTPCDTGCDKFFQDNLEELRSAVHSCLSHSLSAKYQEKNESNRRAGYEVFAKQDSLVITLSSHRHFLKNYWAGRWTSRWIIESPTSEPKLSGKSQLLTHYFENGNVQMHSSKEHSLKLDNVSSKSVKDIAQQIVTGIEQLEDKYQQALEEKYENIGSQALKDLRRALPVSGQKMSWNVRDHQVKRLLQKKGKS
eukprot:gb/GECG01010326.1/.p1 GENE.gb/GECG01010326.1/~~gb/GECG01010326.1/.p1  ORF type:complete len:417 (+),score=82.46 gb/GECG01010326.1/:1-1251(+)